VGFSSFWWFWKVFAGFLVDFGVFYRILMVFGAAGGICSKNIILFHIL